MTVPEVEIRNHTRGEIKYQNEKGVVVLDLTHTKPPVIITISPRSKKNA